MIERFNFYDVYGYFLPGLALLTLIWFPFGLVERFWPAKELSSALAALAFAYTLGHLIQTLALNAIPSQVPSPGGRRRFPSDLILDPGDATFSSDFKKQLAERVKSSLGIDLEVDVEADQSISRKRQDAFFLGRGVLIKEKVHSYAEQFEGMYALMRGFTAAFGLGFFYFAGWAVSLAKDESIRIMATTMAVVTMFAAVGTSIAILASGSKSARRFTIDRATLAALALALLGIGYWLGWSRVISATQSAILAILSLAALTACIRFWAAYRYFAQEFAKSVWRDFASYQVTRSQLKP